MIPYKTCLYYGRFDVFYAMKKESETANTLIKSYMMLEFLRTSPMTMPKPKVGPAVE
jgi:hypothetical protein